MTMGGREAAGDKIQWTRLDQPWFDRIVETLLLRKFRSVAQVEVVDGRGGDGGMDVSVTYPDGRLVIYQLKYYPDGMSGGHRPRRTEVKKSFKQAVNKHEPHEWVLVTPRNYTNSEKRFLRGLPDATPDGKRHPTVDWIGRSALDQMLIDFPEVDRWLTLDHVRNTREVSERERTAFLNSPASDLATRVDALGGLIDATDPDWTWDFGRQGNTTIQTLRALHDNAAIRSPISITFSTMFAADSAAGREFRRSIEFGSPERVTIPGTALTRFEVSGPDVVSGIPDPDRLVIASLPDDESPAVGMLMEIRLLEEGEVVATEEGTVTEVHRGTRGITNVMSFCGNRLTVTAEIPYQAAAGPTSMKVGYRLQGLSPRAVANLIKIVLGLRISSEVEFHIDGQFLTKYKRSTDEIDDEASEFKEQLMIYRFAEDLADVLAHTGQRMTFPTSFSADDRVHARVARLLIEGHMVASPLASGIYGRLAANPSLTPELRDILTEGRDIRWPAGPYSAPIAGREFELGESFTFHPETCVENGAAALEALERGEVSSDQLILKPGDDPYFFVYLPATDPEGHENRWVARWDLDGIDEPWLDRPWLTPEDADTDPPAESTE